MILKNIKIANFRCHESKNVKFSEQLNIVCGNNATGKTSLLEAISVLCITKSFKTRSYNEIIKENKDYFYIEGLLSLDQREYKLSFYADKKDKQMKIGNVVFKKASDYIGFANIVSYTSDDLVLFDGSPSDRMSMFDRIFCQISKDYLNLCNLLSLYIKERNTLLKRLKIENSTKLMNLLNVYDEKYCDVSKKIINSRRKYVEKLNIIASKIHRKISNNTEELQILYSPNAEIEEINEKLKNRIALDIERGYTSVGPKRDDCIFIINNKNTVKYGSQGQKKNALISLKLAFAELIEAETNNMPIILLDDVFGYLDKNRQNALVDCLNNSYQTIITTSSISDINENIIKNAYIISLKEE